MSGISIDGHAPTFQLDNTAIAMIYIDNTQLYPGEGNTCRLNFSTNTGTLSQNSISVLYGSTYQINNNTLTIDDHGTTSSITFTPTSSDAYYEYGSTAVWGALGSSGTITRPSINEVNVTKIEKSYTVTLSWGRNMPYLDESEYHGWDNGDADGNLTVTMLAAHTYDLHIEDSAGQSQSYIALNGTKLATFTNDIDHYYPACRGWYFGNPVTDSDPGEMMGEVTYQTATRNSSDIVWTPGDYIRDHGGSTIKLNLHLEQSWCWTTRYGGGWYNTKTDITKGTIKDYTFNLDGIIAGNSNQYPCVIYVGLGSFASTTTWNYVNGASGKVWYDTGDKFTWSYVSTTNGTFTLRFDAGNRGGGLNRIWYRWIFQRNY